MAELPRDDSFDSTLAFLSEGYNFIRNRCAHYNTDAFVARLGLRPVVCTVGEEAARMFYAPERFTRKSAMPPTALMSLQDFGSVQLKEGMNHTQRKHLFMGLMSSDNIRRHTELMEAEWRRRLEDWEQREEVLMHNEFREILSRATFQWTGVPLKEEEAQQRTKELGAMIDGAGGAGPRNWRGLLLRSRTERWLRALVEDLRAGRIEADSSSAFYLFTWYRENGELLDTGVVAVELLNLLRPSVAIARYLTFAAMAMHEFPECRERLETGDELYLHYFVQELRRYYPFFPTVGGKAKEAFDWKGHHFEEGSWVLLDLYGTNHDARIWEQPEQFRPERFRDWNGSAYNFIPQGGGEFERGHRCPGEWTTIDMVKAGVRMLVHEMRYVVPEQDLELDLSKMPALPASGFIVSKIQQLAESSTSHREATVSPLPQGRRPQH